MRRKIRTILRTGGCDFAGGPGKTGAQDSSLLTVSYDLLKGADTASSFYACDSEGISRGAPISEFTDRPLHVATRIICFRSSGFTDPALPLPAGCGGRLRVRSYRLRVAVVFVHAFGFELVAGGFEASLGFARLCSSSHVFEGLSAFRSADALRFGYHIPATAPNPQTRFALAHRASQSHGPFKRHEEPLPFLVSPAVLSKWESGLGSGCECMRGGRIQRGSARCALTLRRGTQKSLGHSPVEPFRPTAVSGGRINNPERALNLFRGFRPLVKAAVCRAGRYRSQAISAPLFW